MPMPSLLLNKEAAMNIRLGVRLSAISTLLAAIIPPAGAASPADLYCPQSIEQKSVQITNTSPGWSAFVRAPLYLHGAAPMSGPPEELGELVEFSQKRDKDAWIYTYRLDSPFPAGKWLACTYGESGQVTLSKKLDDSTQVCSFRYQRGKHVGENMVTVTCK